MNNHTRDQLYELYVIQNLSSRQIAKLLNMTVGEVKNLLARLHITKERVQVSKEEVHHVYIEKNLTAKEAASELGISIRKFLHKLQDYQIKKPDNLKLKGGPKLLTKEQLQTWYDQGLNLIQMSELSGSQYQTIKRLLKRWLGITWTKDDRYGKMSKEGYKKRSAKKALERHEKESIKEANRKRNRKKGGKMGLLSRIKSRTTHSRKLTEQESRTSSELEMAKILFINNIPAIEQHLIEFYTKNTDGSWVQFDSMPVDFMLQYPQKNNLKIVLEVDSKFHHNEISKNVRRDSRKNYILTQVGYIVIRIPNNLVSEEMLNKLLRIAQDLDKPQLIRIAGVPKYIRKTGSGQELDFKIIIETPEFCPDPILED